MTHIDYTTPFVEAIVDHRKWLVTPLLAGFERGYVDSIQLEYDLAEGSDNLSGFFEYVDHLGTGMVASEDRIADLFLGDEYDARWQSGHRD